MPRYFFHVAGTDADVEGVELKHLAAAKCDAVRTAAQLICDSPGAFWDTGDFTMTISDESGLTLFSLMVVGVDSAATAPLRRS